MPKLEYAYPIFRIDFIHNGVIIGYKKLSEEDIEYDRKYGEIGKLLSDGGKVYVKIADYICIKGTTIMGSIQPITYERYPEGGECPIGPCQ